MTLEITNTNNFFEIKGVLNKFNIHVFEEAFKNIFEKVNSLTICIREIEKIDRYGVNALAKLHNQALVNNKSLTINGLAYKDSNNNALPTETVIPIKF